MRRSSTHVILVISVACLLTACTTNSTAHRKEPPQWKGVLSAAIRLDDVEGVSRVLAQNALPADVALNDNSVTPLMAASSRGSRRVAQWLLDQGAKVPVHRSRHAPVTPLAGLVIENGDAGLAARLDKRPLL